MAEIEPMGAGADPPVAAEEAVDGVPVLADVRAIEPPARASLPAIQAAAAAATGFVAGAAALVLLRRYARRSAAGAGRAGSRHRADLLPIVASRTLLIDVHLIAKPGE